MLPQKLAEELSRVIYGTARRYPNDPGAIDQAVRPILARIWQDWYVADTRLDEVQDERDAWKVRAEVAEKLVNATDALLKEMCRPPVVFTRQT